MKDDTNISIQSTLQWIDHKADLKVIPTLLTYGIKRNFRNGDYILRQGEKAESISYISKGRIQVVMVTPDGKEKTLWYTIAGNIINDVGYFHQHLSNASIIANGECEMYEFTKETVNKLMHKYPEFSEELLVSMAKRIRVLVHQLDVLSFSKPISQICRFLYAFSEKYGNKTGEETHIQLDITHSEIASMSSLHRVTVSKILKKLESENILHYESKGSIYISDIDKLYDYGFNE
jgi:CRP/FNR family transcriptional regulator